jgi:hypothetical protein
MSKKVNRIIAEKSRILRNCSSQHGFFALFVGRDTPAQPSSFTAPSEQASSFLLFAAAAFLR